MHVRCLRVLLQVLIPGHCGGRASVFSHVEGCQRVDVLPEGLSFLRVLTGFSTVNVSSTIWLAARGSKNQCQWILPWSISCPLRIQ